MSAGGYGGTGWPGGCWEGPHGASGGQNLVRCNGGVPTGLGRPRPYPQPPASRLTLPISRGRVVGTVGVRPAAADGGDGGDGELVLKRMAVRRGYRGQGIGAALGGAALAFARQRGCRAVVLNTLMVQHEARALCERLGFRRHRQYVLPTIYGHLANCTVTTYRYELDSSNGAPGSWSSQGGKELPDHQVRSSPRDRRGHR
uniref:N-acetyltransferase domain-containing protein n=1 Tax=Amazona collaria TaxID=241587 RepID=A0A8B9FEL0_9PSIT